MSAVSHLQIVLKYYRCTYLIYKSLIPSCLLANAAVYYRAMCQYRSESFVIKLYRDRREQLLKPRNKLLHTGKIFACLTVHLTRFAYYHPLHAFPRKIILKKVNKRRRGYRSQPVGNNLQRIGYGQARTLLAIIYRQYSCHNSLLFTLYARPVKGAQDIENLVKLFLQKKPCVRVLSTELVT